MPDPLAGSSPESCNDAADDGEYDLPYLPERQEIWAKDGRDAERHRVIRRALVDQLAVDDRVQATFARWSKQSGLSAAAERARAAWLLNDRDRAEAIFGEAWQAFEEDDDATGALEDDAVRLVSKVLDLPWAWVAAELCLMFPAWLAQCITGGTNRVEPLVDRWYVHSLSPPLGVRFRTRHGETHAENRARWEAVRDRVDAAFSATEPLAGGVGGEQGYLERIAGWYYRCKVKRDSIRSVAREAFPAEADRRKTIREGIARAEELLGSTRWMLSTAPRGEQVG